MTEKEHKDLFIDLVKSLVSSGLNRYGKPNPIQDIINDAEIIIERIMSIENGQTIIVEDIPESVSVLEQMKQIYGYNKVLTIHQINKNGRSIGMTFKEIEDVKSRAYRLGILKHYQDSKIKYELVGDLEPKSNQ